MTQLRITVTNISEIGGIFLTPVYFGFQDLACVGSLSFAR